MEKREVIIIGAGPAGLAAAVKLDELAFRDVLVLEKEEKAGGVLRQCIHPGFGLIKLGKNLTGPEYGRYYRELFEKTDAEIQYSVTVTEVAAVDSSRNKVTAGKSSDSADYSGQRLIRVTAQTPSGEKAWLAESVILATGCRERGRGSLEIPGSRPAGIYSAGTAQALMNLKNIKVGSRILIVGSGDIGLIMARRFTLEGSEVVAVIEKEKTPGGLARNRKECLKDFGIPLLTGCQVSEISGKKRAESVTVRDASGKEAVFECDTVILAAGLVPEDGIVKGIISGLFYCGNALYVHDLVDNVSESGEEAALAAAAYILGRDDGMCRLASENVGETREERKAFLRARKSEADEGEGVSFVVCTGCPNSCRISLKDFSGGRCEKGEAFARAEAENPKRIFTSSVRAEGSEGIVSVRTEGAIPRSMLMEAAEYTRKITAAAGVKAGTVLDDDFLGTGQRLVVTRTPEE